MASENDSVDTEDAVSIDPAELEVADTEGGFALLLEGEPITTPGGSPVVHRGRRLLKHIRRELSSRQSIDPRHYGPYSIYSTQKDFIENGQDVIAIETSGVLRSDPLFYSSPGPEQMGQRNQWFFILQFLQEGGCSLESLPWSSGDEDESSEEFYDDAQRERFDALVSYVASQYSMMPPEKRAVVRNLAQIHSAGILLPMAFALGRCSAQEYADGVCAAHATHPRIFEPDWDEYGQALSGLCADVYTVHEYLSNYD